MKSFSQPLPDISLPRHSWPWRLLIQKPETADPVARGFTEPDAPATAALRAAAGSFIEGFNLAIDAAGVAHLHSALAAVTPDLRGFAYEGAGMATAILDLLGPPGSGRGRTAALLAGPGDAYTHLIHVGVGWGYCRLHLRPGRNLPGTHPLYRWLAYDGWGFHRGFFTTGGTVRRRRAEPNLGPRLAVRDQGLGRSLWFCDGAVPEAIAGTIGAFPEARQADLWSGVGLAAGYAGGVPDGKLLELVKLAAPYEAHLAQGVAFACGARARAAHVPEHTERAARVLAGVDAATAAGWTDAAQEGLGGTLGDYQSWRAGIRELWQEATR
ncbi:DUF1702 family protein [Sphaerisporangium sp. NBC_01403]|uniref:DUF1702 family protein n=1 Tax=Sphaerisporangium sp. NBC_01403 TaxID=2903599 RepID=UPI00324A58C8